MTVEWIDTHAHLDEDAFANDLPDVLANCETAGVVSVLTIGTTVASSRAAVELAHCHSQLFAVVGIQPNYVSQAAAGDWEIIETLARDPRVRAVGETGLDRYWDYAPFDQQLEYFQKHLELARQLDLPFVVHCREAEADVVEVLKSAAAAHGPLRGVMHSFAGDAATAEACLALGMHISFAGMVTFKKNESLRQIAATVPADRLLVETDAPYLAPEPFRGKRNEPARVTFTGKKIAEARGVTVEELARQTTQNARQLFRI